MSEPMTSGEIEDVLSSIRRLVSEDFRPVRGGVPKAAVPHADEPVKLLLTPALRIVPGDGADVTRRPQPMPEQAQVAWPEVEADDAIWQDDRAEVEAGFHGDAEPDPSVTAVVTSIGAAVARQHQDWEPETGDVALDAVRPPLEWPASEEAELQAAEAVATLAGGGPGPGDGWNGDNDDDDEDAGSPEPEDGTGEEPEQVGTDTDDPVPAEIEDGGDGDGSDDPAPQDWPEPEHDPESDDQSGNDDDAAMDTAFPAADAGGATTDPSEALPVFDDEEDHDEFYEGGADTEMIGTEVRCEIAEDDADSDGGEIDVAFDGIEARVPSGQADVGYASGADDDDADGDAEELAAPMPHFRSERRMTGSLADAAEREAVAEITSTSGAARDVAGFPESEAYLDEAVLREVVRDLIRAELTGELGTRITRNVRKLVRAEINLALAARELE